MSWHALYCGAVYQRVIVAPNGDEYGVYEEDEALQLVGVLNGLHGQGQSSYFVRQVEDRGDPIVVDQDGNWQSAEDCAQRLNELQESQRLLRAELEGLQTRHAALVGVLEVARRVLARRRSDPEMHNRLVAFSSALRRYEQAFGSDATPELDAKRDALREVLEAGIRWYLPDGPCWCEAERRKNWRTKIHTTFCCLARAALSSPDARGRGETGEAK